MFGGEAVFVDSGDVGFGAVANVLIESVFWIVGGEVYHVAVTGDFSNDGSGRNFFELGISFYVSGDVVFERSPG